MTALSVERCVEVTNKKGGKYSDKFKVAMTIIYLIIVWLSAFFFSLPMILSFESNISEGSYSCDTSWNDATLNKFFIIKYVFIFIVPFSIILLSSCKLLVFLNNWRRKKTLIKLKKSKESMRLLYKSSSKKAQSVSVKNLSENKSTEKSLFEVSVFRTEINPGETQGNSTSFRSNVTRPCKRKVKSKIIRNKAIKIVLCIVLLFFIQW